MPFNQPQHEHNMTIRDRSRFKGNLDEVDIIEDLKNDILWYMDECQIDVRVQQQVLDRLQDYIWDTMAEMGPAWTDGAIWGTNKDTVTHGMARRENTATRREPRKFNFASGYFGRHENAEEDTD